MHAGWWGHTGVNSAFTVNTSEALDLALDHMPQPYKQARTSLALPCRRFIND